MQESEKAQEVKKGKTMQQGQKDNVK